MEFKLVIEQEENGSNEEEQYDELIAMLESFARYVQSKKEAGVPLKNTVAGIRGKTFGKVKLVEVGERNGDATRV